MGVTSVSQKFEFTKEDFVRWTNNIIIFSTPAVLAFLIALSQGVPLKQAAYALYIALVNAAIDLIRKWYSTTEYKGITDI